MAEISSYYYFIILLRAEVVPEGVSGDAEEMTHNPFKENISSTWSAGSRVPHILSHLWVTHQDIWVSQVALVVKNPPVHARDMGDTGLIPGRGRSL